jgi:hypothetical protein
MVRKAQYNGLLCGLVDHMFDKVISILQYTGDTILF